MYGEENNKQNKTRKNGGKLVLVEKIPTVLPTDQSYR
jgi:hypothetical protein